MTAASAQPSRIYLRTEGTLIVGRTEDNDLAIDHPQVSRHHARFERVAARWTVTDLGSTNGTYVNGQRVATAALSIGDVVDLGASRLVLLDESSLERRDYRGNTRVEAQNIAITAGGRRLLEGVSLTLLPSELVGLMGPSGAGRCPSSSHLEESHSAWARWHFRRRGAARISATWCTPESL